MTKARTETPRPYVITKLVDDDDAVIQQAIAILHRRLHAGYEDVLASPGTVRDFLSLRLAGEEAEAFWCVFLTAQNRVIDARELFRGTITQTAVYPREIVKAVLACNAHGVIFAHNHPSGIAEPSRADELLTQQLRQALATIDVRVLDHFVVAGPNYCSFAERGLL